MKKKVLILYANYGSGHKTIAEYIKAYLDNNKNYECIVLDLLQYSIPIIGTLSKQSCELLMSKFPYLWTLIYFGFDNKLTTHVSSNITLKMFNNKKLKQKIKDFNPDITITTHFWGTDLIVRYNKIKLTKSKVVTVVTDYISHDVWLKSLKEMDAIVVSNREEKRKLKKKGLKTKQIHVTGIPISPDMKQNLDKEKLKKKFKINNDKKTVLFFSGGGNGSMLNLGYFKEILKNNYDCNVLFVSGRNKNIENKARELVKKYKAKNVHVFGFVTNINEFYYLSDFVVTKPGGAQITECLLFERPMLLIKSNGGQEIENRRYLVRNKYARNAISKTSFNYHFNELLENDKLRENMKLRIRKLEQNKSMEKLYEIIDKM